MPLMMWLDEPVVSGVTRNAVIQIVLVVPALVSL